MLNYIHLFTILLSFFLRQFSTEDITEWRDYTYIKERKDFYKYHKASKNWHDAKNVCAQEEASLMYPETKEEADAMIAFWVQHDTKKDAFIYVGISAIGTNREFKTIDGKTNVYFKWRQGQPDNFNNEEDCLHMSKDAEFNDIVCGHKYNFICKKSLESLQTTTTTTKRTTTTTTIHTSCNVHANSLVSLKMFVFWPNATVPYYINPEHFDDEQATVILKSLEMFRFMTCIKFTPLMVAPSEGQHVMTFINPEGLMRCKIETKGHSNYNPHLIVLGYNCLNTRELDMIIMRALGLPFEHNRASRDLYIDVLVENIEPSYIQLFTKDCVLPRELQKIPYDPYSIMHFGERDYSKNGHRTIKFKNPKLFEARRGLTPADIKKIGLTPSDIKRIAVLYGPECRTRDRAAKIALCRTYPKVIRRKRDIQDSGGLTLSGARGGKLIF